MSLLKEYPQSANLVPREPISQEMEKIYLEAKKSSHFPESDVFRNIELGEIYEVGQKILGTRDIWQAYKILAEPSPKALCYYDLIIGPQHQESYKAISLAIRKLEPEKVKEGLDIGTGTGLSVLPLVYKCEHITATDIHPSMLRWASIRLNNLTRRGIIKGFRLAIMDAIKLQRFPSNSVDIAVAHGLDSYLTPDEIRQFYNEVYRVLKSGGSFYKFLSPTQESPVYRGSPKAQLAGVVAKALLSFSYAPYYQAGRCKIEPYQRLGFQEEFFIPPGSSLQEMVLRLRKI